jgi:hypothetical protein
MEDQRDKGMDSTGMPFAVISPESQVEIPVGVFGWSQDTSVAVLERENISSPVDSVVAESRDVNPFVVSIHDDESTSLNVEIEGG